MSQTPIAYLCPRVLSPQRDGRLMLLIEDMARHESLPVRWMSKYDASAKRW